MSDDKVKIFLAGDEDAASLVRHDDLHAAIMMITAKARGITTSIVDDITPPQFKRKRILCLDWPDRRAYFCNGRLLVGRAGASIADCIHINGPLFQVVDRKQASKELIRILGFPTPAGRWFDPHQEEAAVAWFSTFGAPACLKPDWGSLGSRVFPGLTREGEFRDAFRLVAERSTMVVAEESFGGAAVRFFYVRPRVIAVRVDLPANVTGDGVSTIAELILKKNRDKKLQTGHKPIEIDDDVLRHLARQSLTLETVPAAGVRLFVRTVSNGSKGGDSLTTVTVHPSYAEQVTRMCNAIRGFQLTAVDTKVLDPSLPATPDNWRILEVNSNPGVVPYHFPWEGAPQDVCGPILEMVQTLTDVPD